MAEAGCQLTKDQSTGRITVTGELNFESVKKLNDQSVSLFNGEDQIEIDLSKVTRADSAGLALLIEWTREARKRNKDIKFYNIPSQMCEIARVSSLEYVLPIYRC